MNIFSKVALASAILVGSNIASADNIHVMMSDEANLALKGTDVYSTGFYLNEAIQPAKMFLDAGHEVTFATPKGMAPSLDKVSDNAMFFGGDESALQAHKDLLKELKLTDAAQSPVISLARVEQIGYGNYDAVYVPGGHAPMIDLLKDKKMGALLSHFHEKKKVTALVCHGPIALLSTLSNVDQFVDSLEKGNSTKASEDWIYSGYKMTVFSNDEEEAAKGWLGGGEMKFYPQSALTSAGGEYQKNETLWPPKVVVDRELITGQNPASAVEVAKEILSRLEK
jgi:putative intracellular protease/amidase